MSKINIRPALRSADGIFVGQNFFWAKRVPHWKRFGEGTAELKVEGHIGAGWVTIDARESSERDSKTGRVSEKQTMLTLDRAAAEALRDTLNAILGGSAREQKTLIGYPKLGVAEGELRGDKPKTRADGRVFRPSEVKREDSGGQLWAPVDQHRTESGDTPSYDFEAIRRRCEELNRGQA